LKVAVNAGIGKGKQLTEGITVDNTYSAGKVNLIYLRLNIYIYIYLNIRFVLT